jgi:hypothetical protein
MDASRRLPRHYKVEKPRSVPHTLTWEVLNSLPLAPEVPEASQMQTPFPHIEHARPPHHLADLSGERLAWNCQGTTNDQGGSCHFYDSVDYCETVITTVYALNRAE